VRSHVLNTVEKIMLVVFILSESKNFNHMLINLQNFNIAKPLGHTGIITRKVLMYIALKDERAQRERQRRRGQGWQRQRR